jgi:hypothetical protein
VSVSSMDIKRGNDVTMLGDVVQGGCWVASGVHVDAEGSRRCTWRHPKGMRVRFGGGRAGSSLKSRLRDSFSASESTPFGGARDEGAELVGELKR